MIDPTTASAVKSGDWVDALHTTWRVKAVKRIGAFLDLTLVSLEDDRIWTKPVHDSELVHVIR